MSMNQMEMDIYEEEMRAMQAVNEKAERNTIGKISVTLTIYCEDHYNRLSIAAASCGLEITKTSYFRNCIKVSLLGLDSNYTQLRQDPAIVDIFEV